jgi:hypothetical protein
MSNTDSNTSNTFSTFLLTPLSIIGFYRVIPVICGKLTPNIKKTNQRLGVYPQ